MKLLNAFLGFFLLVLHVFTSRADISSTLKTEPYLPSSIQELPVQENYYNTQENTQQKFAGKNYGNSGYQIYENNSQNKSPTNSGEKEEKLTGTKQNTLNNNHTPSRRKSEIRIEHNVSADFPDLNDSYQSFARGDRNNNQHEIKKDIPEPFPSKVHMQQSVEQYQSQYHPVNNFPDPKSQTQETATHSSQNSFADHVYQTPQQIGRKADAKASLERLDYLSSQQERSQPNTVSQAPDNLPLRQKVSEISDQSQHKYLSKAAIEDSDYLPPKKEESSIMQPKSYNYLPPQQQIQTLLPSYNGPQYLPPLQRNFQHEHNKQFIPFEDSDYLPPGKSQEINADNQQIGKYYKAPDYLPPKQMDNNVASKDRNNLPSLANYLQQYEQQLQSLPPGYDFQKPANAEEAIAELHKLPDDSPPNLYSSSKEYDTQNLLHNQDIMSNIHSYKASKYSLPVYHFQRIDNSEYATNQKNTHSETENISYSSANAQKIIDRLHSQQSSYETNHESVSHKFSQYSTQQQTQIKHATQNYQTQSYKEADHQRTFSREENKEALKISKSDQKVTQSSLQSFEDSKHLHLDTAEFQTFKGPNYLPPTTPTLNHKVGQHLLPLSSKQRGNSLSAERYSKMYRDEDFLPSVNVQKSYYPSQKTQFKSPEHLLATAPINGEELIYPLSMYMSNIKPNDRYGKRRSFNEQTDIFYTSKNEAPIFRKTTSRSNYFVPDISYTNNALNSQTSSSITKNEYHSTSALNQQAHQSLQTYTAENIQQTSNLSPKAPPQTTKSPNAKVRTVQIINPNKVKTLKIIETLDHAGVKTIKILDYTNHKPMGDHRVVKVVSGSHEQSVQTVKIFNDIQDVQNNANDQAKIEEYNNFLSSKSKRNSESETNASIRVKRFLA